MQQQIERTFEIIQMDGIRLEDGFESLRFGHR
jgi:hypothetical protein